MAWIISRLFIWISRCKNRAISNSRTFQGFLFNFGKIQGLSRPWKESIIFQGISSEWEPCIMQQLKHSILGELTTLSVECNHKIITAQWHGNVKGVQRPLEWNKWPWRWIVSQKQHLIHSDVAIICKQLFLN